MSKPELTKNQVLNYLEMLDNLPDDKLQPRLDAEVAEGEEEKADLVRRELRIRGLLEDDS
jgi:hypothetical protein